MENYISVLVALFYQLELLTEEEAKKLDKKLRTSTFPSTFDEVKVLVERLLEESRTK